MKRHITLTTGLTVMLALACIASAEIIYTNDFGTAEQFDSMIWTSQSGAGTGALAREGALSGPNPPGDLDGDGKYQTVVEDTGFGASRGAVHLFAPLYHTISNITVSGYGRGYSISWSSGATWRISYDGIDWTHDVGSDNSHVWKPYSVSTGPGDPNYTNVADVWACTEVYSVSGTYNAGASGRSGAFQVEADVNVGQPGQRVPVHLNDMGTDEQRAEWFMSGFMSLDDGGGVDTDADGLSGSLQATAPCTAIATIEVRAPEGLAFKDPIATGRGFGADTSFGSHTQVRLSLDGSHWNVASTYPGTPGGWYDMTADATGLAGYQAVESFWLQIHMVAWHGNYLPRAHSVVVTAEMVAGSDPVCGDAGYLLGDIAGAGGQPDCYVNLLDLSQIAAQWLECTEPSDTDCTQP